MTIAFACPTCQKPFRVPDEMVGRQTQCPGCRTALTVPSTSPFTAQPAMAPPSPFTADAAVPGRRMPKLSRKMLMIGGIAAASLCFLAIAAGGVWYFVFSASGPGDELRYLPNNCQVIGSVRVEQLLASDAYKDIKGAMPDKDKDFEKDFEKEKGIPIGNVQSVLFGASLGKETDFVVVVKTNKEITAADISANRKNASFKEVKVGEYSIQEGFGESFCVPEKKIVLFSRSTESLKKVLERGKRPEFSEGLRNAMKQVDFSKTVAVAVNFKDVKSKIEDMMPGGKNLTEMVDLDDIDAAAMEAKVGKDIAVTGVLLCKDEKSAEDMRRLSDGMVVWLKKFKGIPGSKDLGEILDTYQSSTSKAKVTSSLTIRTELTVKIMKAVNEKSKSTFQTVGDRRPSQQEQK